MKKTNGELLSDMFKEIDKLDTKSCSYLYQTKNIVDYYFEKIKDDGIDLSFYESYDNFVKKYKIKGDNIMVILISLLCSAIYNLIENWIPIPSGLGFISFISYIICILITIIVTFALVNFIPNIFIVWKNRNLHYIVYPYIMNKYEGLYKNCSSEKVKDLQ